jgi:hypothetical protein
MLVAAGIRLLVYSRGHGWLAGRRWQEIGEKWSGTRSYGNVPWQMLPTHGVLPV